MKAVIFTAFRSDWLHVKFLLVSFQVDHLSGYHDARKLRRAMSILPSNLEGYYEEAIKRIRNQGEQDSDNVKRATSFIFCAR